MRCPDEILLYIGGNKTDCSDPGICPSYKASYEVAKITVHNYDICPKYNDLALMELSQNISETIATPICMPSENLQLDNVLYAAGSGMDYSAPSTLTDPHRKSHGQQGDSGGPLFQVDATDIHTLVGINHAVDSTDRPKTD
ncbi:hypothetical protein ANCDUO_17281, partial [Ancylostoma duodenale]